MFLIFFVWLILRTIDPMTIGIDAENQWVCFFIVNLDKMMNKVTKYYSLYATKKTYYFKLNGISFSVNSFKSFIVGDSIFATRLAWFINIDSKMFRIKRPFANSSSFEPVASAIN